MKYVEAFNKLGYEVPNPRQDWSAEKSDGICITLWEKEVVWQPSPPKLDIWKVHPGAPGEWTKLPGNKKRIRHLKRALSEFGGWVDVIIVSGTPGKGYGDASIWEPERRRNHAWRIRKLDEVTGFFSAVAEVQA
jgi:hypothetical protein